MLKEFLWAAAGAVVMAIAITLMLSYSTEIKKLREAVYGSPDSGTVAFIKTKTIDADERFSIDFVFAELMTDKLECDYQIGEYVFLASEWDITEADRVYAKYKGAECFTRSCTYDENGRLVRVVFMPMYEQRTFLR